MKNTEPNIDKFCNNNCPSGIELQDLGKQMIEDTRIHRIGGQINEIR